MGENLHRKLKWFAVFSTIVMVFVLLGGALVTKTDSGTRMWKIMALCNGELIPTNITFELVIELSHRLVSGPCWITHINPFYVGMEGNWS